MPFPPPWGTKSQPRTGHTREPDPTHNELKHTITRKTATLGVVAPHRIPRLAAVACLARYAYPLAGVTFTPAQLMSLGLEGRLSLIGTNNITY